MKIPISTYSKLLYDLLSEVDDHAVAREKIRAVIDLVFRHSHDVTLLEALIPAYEAYHDTAFGIKKVIITTAVALGADAKLSLIESVKQMLSEKNIATIFKIDPDLLGGVKVETRDRLFDASVKSAIISLKDHVVG